MSNAWHIEGADNCIVDQGSLLRHVRIRIRGRGNRVRLGCGVRIRKTDILIEGDGHLLEIGECVRYSSGKIKMEDSGCAIRIGEFTTVEDAYLGAFEGTTITIGRDCMFSASVGLRTSDMHSILDAYSGARINPAKDISIGDHVWLARGVTILKGVSVGANSIVGAFSLVTSNIPGSSLAVGSPSTVYRTNMAWDRRRLSCQEKRV